MKTVLSPCVLLMLFGLMFHRRTLAQTTFITGTSTPPLPERVSTTITTSIIQPHHDITTASASISVERTSNANQSTYGSTLSSDKDITVEIPLTKSNVLTATEVHSLSPQILSSLSSSSYSKDKPITKTLSNADYIHESVSKIVQTLSVFSNSLKSSTFISRIYSAYDVTSSDITIEEISSTSLMSPSSEHLSSNNIKPIFSSSGHISSYNINTTTSVTLSTPEPQITSTLLSSFTSLFHDMNSSTEVTEHISDLETSSTIDQDDELLTPLQSTSALETPSFKILSSTAPLETHHISNSISSSVITKTHTFLSSNFESQTTQSLPSLRSSEESYMSVLMTTSDSVKTVTSNSSEPHNTFRSISVISSLSAQSYTDGIFSSLDIVSDRSSSIIHTPSTNQTQQKTTNMVNPSLLRSSDSMIVSTTKMFSLSTPVLTDSTENILYGTSHTIISDTRTITSALPSESKPTETYLKSSFNRPVTSTSIIRSSDAPHTSLPKSISFTFKSTSLSLESILDSNDIVLPASYMYSISLSSDYFSKKREETYVTSVASLEQTPIVSSISSFRDRFSLETNSVISDISYESYTNFNSETSISYHLYDSLTTGDGFILTSSIPDIHPILTTSIGLTETDHESSIHASTLKIEDTPRINPTQSMSDSKLISEVLKTHSYIKSSLQSSFVRISKTEVSDSSSTSIDYMYTISSDESNGTQRSILSESMHKTSTQPIQRSDLTIQIQSSSATTTVSIVPSASLSAKSPSSETSDAASIDYIVSSFDSISFLHAVSGKSSVVQTFSHSMQTGLTNTSMENKYMQQTTLSTAISIYKSDTSPGTVTISTVSKHLFTTIKPTLSTSFYPLSELIEKSKTTIDVKNISESKLTKNIVSSAENTFISLSVVGLSTLSYISISGGFVSIFTDESPLGSTTSQDMHESHILYKSVTESTYISISPTKNVSPSFETVVKLDSTMETTLFSKSSSSAHISTYVQLSTGMPISHVTSVLWNDMSDLSITTSYGIYSSQSNMYVGTRDSTSISSDIYTSFISSDALVYPSGSLDDLHPTSPLSTSEPPSDMHVLSFTLASITHSFGHINISTSSLNDVTDWLSSPQGSSGNTIISMSYFKMISNSTQDSMIATTYPPSMTISSSKTSSIIELQSTSAQPKNNSMFKPAFLSVSPSSSVNEADSVSSYSDILINSPSVYVFIESSESEQISGSSIDRIKTLISLYQTSKTQVLTSGFLSTNIEIRLESAHLSTSSIPSVLKSFHSTSSLSNEPFLTSLNTMISSFKSTSFEFEISSNSFVSIHDRTVKSESLPLMTTILSSSVSSSKSSISLLGDFSNTAKTVDSSFDSESLLPSFTSLSIDSDKVTLATKTVNMLKISSSSFVEENQVSSTSLSQQLISSSFSIPSVSFSFIFDKSLSSTIETGDLSTGNLEILTTMNTGTMISSMYQNLVTNTIRSQAEPSIINSESGLTVSSLSVVKPSYSPYSVNSALDTEIQKLTQTVRSEIISRLSVTSQYISQSMSTIFIESTNTYLHSSLITHYNSDFLTYSPSHMISDLSSFSSKTNDTMTNVNFATSSTVSYIISLNVKTSVSVLQSVSNSFLLVSNSLDTSVYSPDVVNHTTQGISKSSTSTKALSMQSSQLVDSSPSSSGFLTLNPSTTIQYSSSLSFDIVISETSGEFLTSINGYLEKVSSIKDTFLTSLYSRSEYSGSYASLHSSYKYSQSIKRSIQNSMLISSVTPTSYLSVPSLLITSSSNAVQRTTRILDTHSTSDSVFGTSIISTSSVDSYLSTLRSLNTISSKRITPSILDVTTTSFQIDVSPSFTSSFVFPSFSASTGIRDLISSPFPTTSLDIASGSPFSSVYLTPTFSATMPFSISTITNSLSLDSSFQRSSFDSVIQSPSHWSSRLSTQEISQFLSPSVVLSTTSYDSSILLYTSTSSLAPSNISRTVVVTQNTELPSSPPALYSGSTIVILPSVDIFTSSANYTDSITLTYNESVTVASESGISSKLVSMSATENITFSTSITPITSSVTPQTSPPPTIESPPEVTTLNATTAEEPFWVRTVLKIRQNVDVTSGTFKADLERKLAIAFEEAFVRERLIEQGKFEPLRKRRRRKKRYTKVGDAAVHIHEISREQDSSKVSAVYTVEKEGEVLTATEAVAALSVLDTQEVAILLQQVLDTKAETYLHAEPTNDTSKDSSQLWLVAAIGGPVLAFAVFIWIVLCAYFKCCSRKRSSGNITEPKLTSIQESPKKVSDLSAIREPSPHTSKKNLPHQGSRSSLLRPKVRAYEVTPPPEPEIIIEENKVQNSPVKKKNRPLSESTKPNGALIKVQPPETPPRSATTSPRYKKGKKHRRNSIEPLAQEIRDIPVVYDDRNLLLHSSLSDDNEELQERARRERRKNKDRQRERRKKERDDQSRVAEYVTSQNHLNTLGLPHSPVPSVHIERTKETLQGTH